MFFPAIKDSYFKMRQHFIQAEAATGDVLQKKVCNFIKKETLAQVFPCEFCEIFKNTFFTEHLRWLLLFRRICCTKPNQNPFLSSKCRGLINCGS